MNLHAGRQGSALVLALVMMVIFGLLVGVWSEQLLVSLRQGTLLRAHGHSEAAAESGVAAAMALLAAHPELLPNATPEKPAEPILVYEPAPGSELEGILRPALPENLPPVACGSYFFAVFYQGADHLRVEALGRTMGAHGRLVNTERVAIVKIVSKKPILLWEHKI